MSTFKSIDDLDVAGKRVLVRADLNMPMKDGRITDASRMEKTLPTLNDLLDRDAGVIVMSHMGRPRGQVVAELSLAPVARTLAETLGRDVPFAADCIGPEAEKAVEAVSEGGVAMLENLRFHGEEEANDVVFAGKLDHGGIGVLGDDLPGSSEIFEPGGQGGSIVARLSLVEVDCDQLVIDR